MGPILASRFGVEGNDAMVIGSLFDLINLMLQQFGLTLTSNPQMVEKELSECPFQNAAKEMCVMFEAFGNGVCEAINPEFEIVHTEAMCAGDATCRRIIRRKALMISKGKRSYDPQNKNSSISEGDLLLTLKMRLAKGEIIFAGIRRTERSSERGPMSSTINDSEDIAYQLLADWWMGTIQSLVDSQGARGYGRPETLLSKCSHGWGIHA